MSRSAAAALARARWSRWRSATCARGAAGCAEALDGVPDLQPAERAALAGGTPQSAQLGTPFSDPLQVDAHKHERLPDHDAARRDRRHVRRARERAERDLLGQRLERGARRHERLRAPRPPPVHRQPAGRRLHGGRFSDYGSVTFSLVNTAAASPRRSRRSHGRASRRPSAARYAQPLQATVTRRERQPGRRARSSPSRSVDAGRRTGGAPGECATSTAPGQVSELTNASGIATSPLFTANRLPGSSPRLPPPPARTTSRASRSTTSPASRRRSPSTGARSSRRPSAPRYAKPLQVTVRDGAAQPLQGASVTFASVPPAVAMPVGERRRCSFAGGGDQATETTNAAGVATSPRLIANTTAGSSPRRRRRPGRRRRHGSCSTTVAGRAGGRHRRHGGDRIDHRRDALPDPARGHRHRQERQSRRRRRRHASRRPHGEPSGRFDGKKTHVSAAKTDANGIAVAPPFVAEPHDGRLRRAREQPPATRPRSPSSTSPRSSAMSAAASLTP